MNRDCSIIDTITPYYLPYLDKNRMTFYIPIGKLDIDQYIKNINLKKLIILNSTDNKITGPFEDCTINIKNINLSTLLSFLSFTRYYEDNDYRKIIKYFKKEGDNFEKNIAKNLQRFYFFSNFFNLNWKHNYDIELKNVEIEREDEYKNLKIEYTNDYFYDCLNFIKSIIFS